VDEEREIGGPVVIEINIEFSQPLENSIAGGKNYLGLAGCAPGESCTGSQGIEQQSSVKRSINKIVVRTKL